MIEIKKNFHLDVTSPAFASLSALASEISMCNHMITGLERKMMRALHRRNQLMIETLNSFGYIMGFDDKVALHEQTGELRVLSVVPDYE